MGSAGLPDGFIGLGVLAVLPGALPVVVPREVFGVVPVAAPEPMVPEGVPTLEAPGAPVPLAPAAPPLVWAIEMVLVSANAPANAMVIIFMVVSSWLLAVTNGIGRRWFRVERRSKVTTRALKAEDSKVDKKIKSNCKGVDDQTWATARAT